MRIPLRGEWGYRTLDSIIPMSKDQRAQHFCGEHKFRCTQVSLHTIVTDDDITDDDGRGQHSRPYETGRFSLNIVRFQNDLLLRGTAVCAASLRAGGLQRNA